MAFAGSKTNDIQGAFIQTRCRFHLSLTDWHKGDLQIPCEGEYFLSTSGVKFVPELQYEDDLQNLGTSSEDDGEGFREKTCSPNKEMILQTKSLERSL